MKAEGLQALQGQVFLVSLKGRWWWQGDYEQEWWAQCVCRLLDIAMELREPSSGGWQRWRDYKHLRDEYFLCHWKADDKGGEITSTSGTSISCVIDFALPHWRFIHMFQWYLTNPSSTLPWSNPRATHTKMNHVSMLSEGPWLHYSKRGSEEQLRLEGAGTLPVQRKVEFEGTARVRGKHAQICKQGLKEAKILAFKHNLLSHHAICSSLKRFCRYEIRCSNKCKLHAFRCCSLNNLATQLVFESPVFWLFDPFFELEHCCKNSPSQLGCGNINFRVSPVLGPEKFPFQVPQLCGGDFNFNVLAAKLTKKSKNWTFKHYTQPCSQNCHDCDLSLLPWKSTP